MIEISGEGALSPTTVTATTTTTPTLLWAPPATPCPGMVLDHAHQSLADGPVPYDAIIDIAGAARLREQRAVLAERGSIVFVGAETGEVWTGGYGRPARRALRMVVARQRYVMLASAVRADGLTRLADEVTAAGVRPHVHATYALADAATAMAELEAGRVAGKVVVRVGG